ncbi:MAG: sulfite exporter TauE/SafE family protein [Elusimicrobia bacterium]|nr:sulfite exporter TauE/SafE family protein [Elusimicrobiota bacterium]
MNYLIICAVALVASGLTFFSGFGLGTLLLPAFSLFFPVSEAVALTAVVHGLNNLFKLFLVGRHANRKVLLTFGLPAIAASFAGAALLLWLSAIPPVASYEAFGRLWLVMPVKLVIGFLLLVFAAIEVVPSLSSLTFGPRYMALGGALSGFFGGLSGMQGALRSAFLVRAGLAKEEFIATGVVIACLIDASRIGVYARSGAFADGGRDHGLLAAAVLSAFAGAYLGNRYLKKLTMQGIQRLVAAMLAALAVGLMAGIL